MRYITLQALTCGVLVAVLNVLVTSAMAEEGLLWKSESIQPAVVVPAYAGQPSPFPTVKVAAAEVSSTDEMDEKRRMRDEAFQSADRLVASGAALRPDLRVINVGGLVNGTLGSRALIGNQWVAVGAAVQVPQYKSSEALEAIKTLAEYDADAAQDLTSKLNGQLVAHRTLPLVLQRITSDTLVFKSSRGLNEIKFNMNSN